MNHTASNRPSCANANSDAVLLTASRAESDREGKMCAAEQNAYYSKLSAENRTALPRAVRERLKVSPGDRLRYVVDDMGVRVERGAAAPQDETLATFSEWSSRVDEEAFADL
jgi:bifunctional DNA-binding transcriptional regulator/antitoxin component of YhaV-PrlF toxin-antitoxin module